MGFEMHMKEGFIFTEEICPHLNTLQAKGNCVPYFKTSFLFKVWGSVILVTVLLARQGAEEKSVKMVRKYMQKPSCRVIWEVLAVLRYAIAWEKEKGILPWLTLVQYRH